MEVKVNIPESLSEIKVGDYQDFIRIASKEGNDDLFIRQKMVQIFCNIPLLAVSKMKRSDFMMVSNAILSTLQEKCEFVDRFELDGKPFGFIPNLNTMSLGEFIDLDSYIKELDDHHKLMAVLYRPITIEKKGGYLIEDYEGSSKYAELMKYAPVSVMLGAKVFFWKLAKQLLRISPKYLGRAIAKDKRAAAVLEKNGLGISTYIRLLEETCSSLEMSLQHPYERLSLS